jgi:hypothetical protein
VISNPEVNRTLATLRKAEFGFLGVIVEKLTEQISHPYCHSTEPYMRFSPHTAPRSTLSKSLDPFPRSRISSLLPLRLEEQLGPIQSRFHVPIEHFPFLIILKKGEDSSFYQTYADPITILIF